MPQLVVEDSRRMFEFLKAGLGAEPQQVKADTETGKVLLGKLLLDALPVMVSDASSEHGERSPEDLGDSPVTLHLYSRDPDARFQAALEAGATALIPMSNAPWGGRFGLLRDPCGHRWALNSAMPED